jgi:hypothetical protein
MGHHYVPQEYLRGFASSGDPGLIWTYDKKTHFCRCLPIRNVAQEPKFYDPDVEAELAQRLEGPANIILAQLRAGDSITPQQRTHFAIYIATMMKRVPRRRRIARENILPKALDETVEKFIADLKTSIASDEQLAARLAEAERVRDEFRVDPPKEVIDHIKAPWPTVAMIKAIASMTWRLAFTQGPQLFVTSDNPAFFFDAFGVGTAQSEVSFPLSPNLALLGSRQGESGATLFVEVRQIVVREVNRRTVANAERLIFANEQQRWLPALISKSRSHLSRIDWTP